MFGSGMTALIISNEGIKDIMKIVKSLEESGLLWKGVNKTIEMKQKNKKEDFSECYLGTLGASLIGNLLTGKGIIRASEGTFRAGQDF